MVNFDTAQGKVRGIVRLRETGGGPLGQIKAFGVCQVKLTVASAQIGVIKRGGPVTHTTLLTGTRYGSIPGIPRGGTDVLSAKHHAADSVIRPPNLGSEARGSAVAAREPGGDRVGVVVQRVDPAIAEILEVGIETAN